MLQELRVSNFAIIDNIELTFRPGFNVLSGETGAGKSVLLKSLGLLMGEKAEASAIRAGAESAVIEGSFDVSLRPDIRQRLEDMGIESSQQTMIVRRIVAAGAKARVYINGALSTLAALRDVVSPLVEVTGQAVPLIEMTGQHDNRHLLSKSYHLELLDQYAGTSRQRQEFSAAFAQRRQIAEKLERLRSEERNRALQLDFLVFQRDEIRALDLQVGDEVAIEAETKRMKHSARLLEFAASIEQSLDADDDSALARLAAVLNRAGELRSLDDRLEARVAPLEQAKTLIQDVLYEIRNYGRDLESDPSRLEEYEARLSRLRQLQKKYGPTAESILGELEKIEAQIHELETSEQTIAALEAEEAALAERLRKLGAELHTKRVAAAELFTSEVNAELSDLNMKGVVFGVQINALDIATSTGPTDAEFVTRTSKSDLDRPLAKAASGGELSRILLSIKQVVGTGAYPRTYLFDEVDTGVSGETAEKVGRKLQAIAVGQQVIGVTHLPQVAVCGDLHFFISKSTRRGETSMDVRELTPEQRVHEIARLISGEKVTSTSLAHARELLSAAKSAPAAKAKKPLKAQGTKVPSRPGKEEQA